jgi:hypothetical protein
LPVLCPTGGDPTWGGQQVWGVLVDEDNRLPEKQERREREWDEDVLDVRANPSVQTDGPVSQFHPFHHIGAVHLSFSVEM